MKKIMLVFLFVAFFCSYSSAYTISRSLNWGEAPASWTIDAYAPNGAGVMVVAGVNRYCATAAVLGYYSNGSMVQVGTSYQGTGASWPSTSGNPLVRFVINLTNPNSCNGPTPDSNNPTSASIMI